MAMVFEKVVEPLREPLRLGDFLGEPWGSMTPPNRYFLLDVWLDF